MQGFPFDSQLTFDDENLPVYDRAVSSQPLRKLIRDLFTTGVVPNPSTNLQVSSGLDGMTVQVQAGFAVIDGGLCQETETRTLEVTAADTTYDRIDTVVVRWNENVDVRTADLYVVAGTPSATPVRPALQRDNSIYEIGLADIFVTKRVATITDDKITDTRYEAERCGIVSSVSEWDTTTIYQQIQADLAGFKANEEAEFTTWFNYMKDQLSEDAAGRLQQEIDEINAKENTTAEFATTSIELALKGLIDSFVSSGTYTGRFKATITPNKWFSYQIDLFDNVASGYIVNTVDPNESYNIMYRTQTDVQATIIKTLSSHIGMVIHSTTLDTEAKVIATYGGTSWSKIEGRVLVGEGTLDSTHSYAINATGGEPEHKLTIAEMPAHNHAVSSLSVANVRGDGASNTAVGNLGYSHPYTDNVGGSQAHNIMQPYKVVYIWERTA